MTTAFISEIDYFGAGVTSGEYVEITILKTEDLSDYTVSFYNGLGLAYGAPSSDYFTDSPAEITLAEVSALTGTPGSVAATTTGSVDLQIVEHPEYSDYWVIQIPASVTVPFVATHAQAVALTNTATDTTIDAYSIGTTFSSGTDDLPDEGVAAGESLTSVGTFDTNLDSIQIDSDGNITNDEEETIGDSEIIICFTSGTLIATENGHVAIDDLVVGDMVETMDHGLQPIRWIGSTKRKAVGKLAPVLIRKGALGNERDLRVSQQHRMLLKGYQAEVLFGEDAQLLSAKSLVNGSSVAIDEGGEVEYFHMMFDQHEIVFAEGAASESFHPGVESFAALDQAARNEIFEIFPQLKSYDFTDYGPLAYPNARHNEAIVLGKYMVAV